MFSKIHYILKKIQGEKKKIRVVKNLSEAKLVKNI